MSILLDKHIERDYILYSVHSTHSQKEAINENNPSARQSHCSRLIAAGSEGSIVSAQPTYRNQGIEGAARGEKKTDV